MTLILGGARSGKSRLAQTMAEEHAGPLLYLATGQPFDAEMTDRIARHQADRGPRWRTVECPLDLPETIAREDASDRLLLIDCLTLWLSNLLLGEHDIEARAQALLAALADAKGRIILVTNEVGLGIVPENALARSFRDEAGRLNQRIAAAAQSVILVAAGLSLILK
ncbi:bifunctional adenosylcobinamide kinase/adenosylcobinamide-phosphate guanylyltransferase [Sphingomonas oleivorans]|uniref:Bifunctional adenosylcobalamin biosynthesis protein n=1 Tax=Sphingomonas oleivorans TaxID=1735121 RepID=A0A2T5G291_9SPHN|nr:bifunctional adenosylcobinamide kinase/adenosylcobinamide-phosphate guanylyltransferase [Sphingomonas oleivorans]PTQ13269.1 bifunctional adenosylcobinamide kinase/adenosylcobinamide-phosphate guanylyltransferase [Sphingomonas oleivorans]